MGFGNNGDTSYLMFTAALAIDPVGTEATVFNEVNMILNRSSGWSFSDSGVARNALSSRFLAGYYDATLMRLLEEFIQEVLLSTRSSENVPPGTITAAKANLVLTLNNDLWDWLNITTGNAFTKAVFTESIDTSGWPGGSITTNYKGAGLSLLPHQYSIQGMTVNPVGLTAAGSPYSGGASVEFGGSSEEQTVAIGVAGTVCGGATRDCASWYNSVTSGGHLDAETPGDWPPPVGGGTYLPLPKDDPTQCKFQYSGSGVVQSLLCFQHGPIYVWHISMNFKPPGESIQYGANISMVTTAGEDPRTVGTVTLNYLSDVGWGHSKPPTISVALDPS
jgi:hypothetical protein